MLWRGLLLAWLQGEKAKLKAGKAASMTPSYLLILDGKQPLSAKQQQVDAPACSGGMVVEHACCCLKRDLFSANGSAMAMAENRYGSSRRLAGKYQYCHA